MTISEGKLGNGQNLVYLPREQELDHRRTGQNAAARGKLRPFGRKAYYRLATNGQSKTDDMKYVTRLYDFFTTAYYHEGFKCLYINVYSETFHSKTVDK